MEEELKRIESQLRVSEWRWQVTQVIAQIPSGYLVTYGRVAEIANKTYGLNIGARNVAWTSIRSAHSQHPSPITSHCSNWGCLFERRFEGNKIL